MGERRNRIPPSGGATGPADESAAAGRHPGLRDTTGLRGGEILTLLRHYDIPCSVDSFSPHGWTARLGDPARGFYAQQGRFGTLDAAARWLLEEARRHYRQLQVD